MFLPVAVQLAQAMSLHESTDPTGRTADADKPPASAGPSKTVNVSDVPNTALPAETPEALRAWRPDAERDVDTASGRPAFVRADRTGGVPLPWFNGRRAPGHRREACGAPVAQRR